MARWRGVTFDIPIRTVSEANLREHWAARAGRSATQKLAVRVAVRSLPELPNPLPPLRVTLMRIAERKMDSDNLAISNKHIQDALAEWLGIDDGDEDAAVWEYVQVKGKRGEYAVRVQVQPR